MYERFPLHGDGFVHKISFKSKMLTRFFVILPSVRDKKDLPLDPVDHKDQDGSFDYQ